MPSCTCACRLILHLSTLHRQTQMVTIWSGDLPYGLYSVWAESATQSAVIISTIELGEVNATVALDLPVIDNSADVELMNVAQIFLPLISH